MTSLISRCGVNNFKRFGSAYVLFKVAVAVSSKCIDRNLRSGLSDYSFLNNVACSTSSQRENLDNAADQSLSKETAKVKLIKSVEKVFHCTHKEARHLVNNNHLLYTLEVSLHKIEVLRDIGITVQTIKENIWILSFTGVQLQRYYRFIKKWEFKDFNDAISMFKLPLKNLEKYTRKMEKESSELVDYGNRIKFFVRHIQCTEKEACSKFVKHQFMFRIDINYLKTNMKILLGVGCEPSWLLRDVQDFRYSPQFLEERVNKVKEMQDEGMLDPVKPWMLRCKTDILERTCNIREEKHAILSPHTTVTDFLCDQLQLSPEQLEVMLAKQPAVRNVHVSKLKETIDFLYVEGFSSSQIYCSPRVLCHSLITLKERLKILQDLGYTVKSLLTLCKNSKDFKELLKKLKEREKYQLRPKCV